MEDNPNNQLLEQLPTQDEIIQINNNNEQTPSDYIPPQINDNNNNNTPQEIPPQQENPSIQIQTPQQKPKTIYEELNVKDPLSQNLISSTPETNIDNTNNNNNQIDTPVTITIPERMEIEEPKKKMNHIMKKCVKKDILN